MAQLLAGRTGEIAVIGLGRSGVAAARLLRSRGGAVYASDRGGGAALEGAAQGLRAIGVTAELGGHDLDRIARAGLVILSPGVPPDAAPVAAARAAGREIWSEAELGLRALAGRIPFAAVTGTNGKTTTTALIAHLLAAGGRRAVAAGNIGMPLSEVALVDPPPDAMAVELSSFQLHDMPTLAPPVGVLTNLAPDHLDRYASREDYYRDKMRLFANAGPGSIWVLNVDDPTSLTWVGRPPGRRLEFSLARPADAWLDRDAGRLRLGDTPLLERRRLPLLGDHNVANALAAALAGAALGVEPPALATGLETALPLPHRMEPIGEVGGVLWVNDSKATNIASTEVAVAAMDRPFVLLLGGRHKGEPYTRLGPALAGRCRAVVAFGEAADLVTRDLDGVVPVTRAGTFDEVMAAARKLARPGDAVLLSPACSSYDMFTNYEERGNRFRAMVEGR